MKAKELLMEKNFQTKAKAEKWFVINYISSDLREENLITSICIPALKIIVLLSFFFFNYSKGEQISKCPPVRLIIILFHSHSMQV